MRRWQRGKEEWRAKQGWGWGNLYAGVGGMLGQISRASRPPRVKAPNRRRLARALLSFPLSPPQ